MHRDPEAQPLLARGGRPCADHIAMRANRGGVPRLMPGGPGIEAVVMIGERNEKPRAGLLVARDEFVGFPVQQRPLRAEVLVAEARGGP